MDVEKKEAEKCEHRDKVYLYYIEDYTGRPQKEVWRCQECNQLVKTYVTAPTDGSA